MTYRAAFWTLAFVTLLSLPSGCGQVTSNPDPSFDTTPDVSKESPAVASPDGGNVPEVTPGGGLDGGERPAPTLPIPPADAGTDVTTDLPLPVCDIRFECKVEGPLNHCRCPDGGV